MKKLLIPLLVLMMVGSVSGNDLSATITDVSVSADTTAMRVDTAYTPSMRLNGVDKLSFSVEFIGSLDTAMDADTCVVNLQMSPNNKDWTTYGTEIVSQWLLGMGDSIFNSTLVLGLDSIWAGSYARGEFIYSDSLEDSTQAGTRVKNFRLWILGKP